MKDSTILIGAAAAAAYFLLSSKNTTASEDTSGVSNVQVSKQQTETITGKTAVTDAQTNSLRQAEQKAVIDALSQTTQTPVVMANTPIPTKLVTNTLKFNPTTGSYDGQKIYQSGTVTFASGYSSPSKQYENAAYTSTSYKVISSNDLKNVSDAYAKKLGLK